MSNLLERTFLVTRDRLAGLEGPVGDCARRCDDPLVRELAATAYALFDSWGELDHFDLARWESDGGRSCRA